MSEREWRRQNLEWERRRREADLEGDKSHRRVVDERRDRMVLRQQQREKDYKLKKQTDLANKNSQDLTRAVKVRYYAYLTFSLYDICNLTLVKNENPLKLFILKPFYYKNEVMICSATLCILQNKHIKHFLFIK